MELEATNSGPNAKLPILKLGEYEMWAIRIKQYFQIQDYALWEVIENGDSWVSVSQTTKENGITIIKMSTPITVEEKTKKKNDVKARGLLLMALLNEHQLTFSQYPDAKSMFAAIETRRIEDKSKVECCTTVISFWDTFARECLEASISKKIRFDVSDRQKNKSDNIALNGVLDSEKQYDDLVARKHETEFKAITFKRGLDTVKAQLVTYRKNKVLFSKEVVVLKKEVGIKQYEINTLKTEFEKLKQEKDAIDFKIEKFGKASKDLDLLLGSQITDKSKKGFGYSAVPLPRPLIYNRPNKLDMSYSGLDEFKEPEFKGYGPENSTKESNVGCEKESDNSKENFDKSLVKEQESQVKSSFVKGCGSNTSKSVSEVEPKKVRENNDAPIIKEWVSDDEEQDKSKTKPEKKTVIPTYAMRLK
ncbi:hypothetical protein Tco_0653739 [Tanacetum coccineum]|uniref:Uncharacterized protein n=1 Tax=Tanacetum coccineum TaxID=301880 RepID=A0ABQ4X1Q5_9ASTR